MARAQPRPRNLLAPRFPASRTSVALPACVLLGLFPLHARSDPDSVRLAHDTRSDLLLTYDINLHVTIGDREAGTVRQRGTWTGFVTGPNPEGHMECVQLLRMDPPEQSDPHGLIVEPAQVGIQMDAHPWSRSEVRWTRPAMIESLRPGLDALWSWQALPEQDVRVGQTWQIDRDRTDHVPDLQFTLTQVDQTGAAATATVEYRATRNSPDALAVRGNISWDLSTESLRHAQGVAEWAHAGQTFRLSCAVTRSAAEVVAREQGEAIRASFADAMNIARTHRNGELQNAFRLAQEFLRDRPESPWRGLAESIVAANKSRIYAGGVLDRDRLIGVLSRLLIAWQETASAHPGEDHWDVAEWIRLSGEFRLLLEMNRPLLLELSSGEQVNHRAMACFAFGFSNAADDLARLIGWCEDAEPQVRAWSVYALAVRADPQTDPRLLIALLGDEHGLVRARSCQAAGACLYEVRAARGPVRRKLLKLLEDDSPQVRFQAAVAFERFGESGDHERIRRLIEFEEVPLIRTQLKRLVGVED